MEKGKRRPSEILGEQIRRIANITSRSETLSLPSREHQGELTSHLIVMREISEEEIPWAIAELRGSILVLLGTHHVAAAVMRLEIMETLKFLVARDPTSINAARRLTYGPQTQSWLDGPASN